MRNLTLLCALLLVACAPQAPQSAYAPPNSDDQWVDAWRRGRGDVELEADSAACRYERTRIGLVAGPVGWGIWRQCMAARGWELAN